MSLYLPRLTPRTTKIERKECVGWSKDATIRNRNFLQSVFLEKLTGQGLSFTLTVKDCPETPKDFARLLKIYIDFLRVKGLIRYHWVIEWQRRGVPHIHMTAYFLNEFSKSEINKLKSKWTKLAKKYKCLVKSQHIVKIHNIKGWLEYSAKHGSRGASNYQRNSSNIPKGWQKKTGRVWGKGGDWELMQTTIDLTVAQFHKFRRILKNWRISNARETKLLKIDNFLHQHLIKNTKDLKLQSDVFKLISVTRRKRIVSARNCLKCTDKGKSGVRGMNEWLSFDNQIKIVKFLLKTHKSLQKQ